MSTSLVLTVIGEDRPGLVEAISRVVVACDANWEASHMARLGGRFAGVLMVTVATSRAEELTAALGDLPGLRVIVEDSTTDDSLQDWVGFDVELVGNDRPGIIRDISKSLAERGATLVELSSSCESAPMSGGLLFRMRAQVRCPPGVERKELRATLENLAHELMVDLELRE